MKKVVRFLSFAFLGSFLVVATALASDKDNSGKDAKASENSLREQFTSVLSNVTFEAGNEVDIYFTLSPEKGFKLDKVSGENSELTSDVKRTLSAKSFAVQSNLEGKYVIKVKFEDISSL